MDPFRSFGKRRRPRSGFWPALFGGVIGGLIVFLASAGWGDVIADRGVRRAPPPAALSESETPARQGPAPTPVAVEVTSAVSDVVSRVEDGIVGVVNLARQSDFWSRKSGVVMQGTGSGIIFHDDGSRLWIATNHHVIEEAGGVEVVLPDGRRLGADILGADRLSDLAVLAIPRPTSAYAVLTFGDSDRVRVGEPAIAIGNPLGLDYSRTVTVGVVSATNRTIPLDLNGDGHVDWELDVIQTDAAINPGNSGGALLNIAGQVIGIASAKISEVGVEGIGFAIPSNSARPILQALSAVGRVERPYLGIGPKDLQEFEADDWRGTLHLPADVRQGVVLVDVTPLGPADRAGLREMDVIVGLDGVPIGASVALRKYLYTQKQVGDTIRIVYYRDGERREATATLGRMP
ncbi:MAG: trypsin-like peptidase domain-containing protein [Hydrogenibacillus sp.]|nr:trypsin-like peptidase domain-containing protein [Hydrogenibacillus sp.]